MNAEAEHVDRWLEELRVDPVREPDADRRRMIGELWTEDGRHILQPPQEIRDIATRPKLAMTAILEARGYGEIVAKDGEGSQSGPSVA